MVKRVKRQQNAERALFLRELGFEPKAMLVQKFGSLAPTGAKRLEEAVINAFKIYYWDRFGDLLAPPSSKVEHYHRVRTAADRLIHLLSGEPEERTRQPAAEFEPMLDRGLAAALCRVLLKQAADSDLAYSILASARLSHGGAVEEGTLRGHPVWLTHHAVLRLAALYLGPIARAAHIAQLEAAAELTPGRGGRRHTKSKATVRLLVALINVYDQVRRRYPKSGEPLGYSRGGPLERFVRAALDCADKVEYPELRTITPDAIRGAFRRYRREAATGGQI